MPLPRPLAMCDKSHAGCPHQRVQYCPLYVAAHTGRGGSCMYGDIVMGCAVERGEMNYEAAMAPLRISEAKIVAQCRFNEVENDRLEQRLRNMRLSGIH